MADLSKSARNSVALQREMFRLAEAEHGLSLAVLVRTRGIPLSTIKGWRDGAAMPAWALGELRLPDDLTSLVLSPYVKHIGTDEEGEGDLQTLAHETAGFTSEFVDRIADGVICHQDKAEMAKRARKIIPLARKVAA